MNVAQGIKYIGLIQALLNNSYLNNDFLIIDEPENHLHPKWQLEFAKLIVEIAKLNNRVLVNSHSPYMIEALQRYSDLKGMKEKTNFYLAKDGQISQSKNGNEDTYAEIFKYLSEPFDEFEKMDSERFQQWQT